MRQRVIRLEASAPAKPPLGEACNGCGVCCAWAPCPLGAVLSGRRSGPCRLLRWHAGEARYRCGALERPPRLLAPLPSRWQAALLRRWIGAGRGCDAALDAAPADAAPGP